MNQKNLPKISTICQQVNTRPKANYCKQKINKNYLQQRNEKLTNLPDLLKSFYDSVSKAKNYDDYSDLQAKKQNNMKITEYENKVKIKKAEIEKYMETIDEKSSVIQGFSQQQ